MAAKYWIKLYHEIIHDPKMGRLPDRVWRRAIEMFLIAGENGNDGVLPPIEDMAWTLRMHPDELGIDLVQLDRIGIVTIDDNMENPVVANFADRQRESWGQSLPAHIKELLEKPVITEAEYDKCIAASAELRLQELRGMPYSEYLKTAHWKKTSARARKLGGYECEACESKEDLRVHHMTYENLGCEKDDDLQVLCKECHAKIHGITTEAQDA